MELSIKSKHLKARKLPSNSSPNKLTGMPSRSSGKLTTSKYSHIPTLPDSMISTL